MDSRAGRKARPKPRTQEPFPSLDWVLRSSLVAVQFGVLLTIVLQVVGA